MNSTPGFVSGDQRSIAIRSILAMADGDPADFDEFYHPAAVDRENPVQPPSSRVPGPDGFRSTAEWLRTAFADLRYEIHHALADDTLVAVESTMSGRHVAVRRLRRWWAGRDGVPADGEVVRDHPVALVPGRGRSGDRALGEP